MAKNQHYMTYEERIRLEEKLRYKVPKAEIARELGLSLQTIYNEIKRGSYQHEKDGFLYWRYSADKGQDIFRRRQRRKTGRPLKIGSDYAYADYLENKILREHRSPAAALAEARRQGFKTSISVGTLYNYISSGVFYELTDADLLEKTSRKPRKKQAPKIAHPKLPSIEQRPEQINRREEPGHWEMDLITGRAGSRPVLLTLTERVSREEIIRKLPDRRAATIRQTFDRMERSMGKQAFRRKFRSITTDNGPEFLEHEQLISSIYGGERFRVFYCHSYAAWEKGSNENSNRIIRRFFPKGTDFAKVTRRQVAEVEIWMNHYPRRSLGWKCPAEVKPQKEKTVPYRDSFF